MTETSNDVLSDVLKYYKKCEEKKLKYGLDNKFKFNFFSSISDIYYRENFHSDILKMILDPKTKGVGNRQFLDSFLKLIGCDPNSFKCNVICTREEKKIDILIKSNKEAIIIENKINGAIDQPNQLIRYIKALQDEKIDVKKVVYLTLTEEKKINPLMYTGVYKKYIEGLKSDKIIYLAAINNKDNNLISFLDECIKIAQKQEKEKKNFSVFLTHYKELLMHLGGKIMMEDDQKKLVKKIYSKKENIKAVEELQELFKNDWQIDKLFGEAVIDKIQLHDSDYCDLPDQETKTIIKRISDNFVIAISTPVAYGFIALTPNGRFSSKQKKILSDILNISDFDLHSSKRLFKNTPTQWIYREFDFSKLEYPTIKETVDIMIEKLQLLEKKCKELKNK